MSVLVALVALFACSGSDPATPSPAPAPTTEAPSRPPLTSPGVLPLPPPAPGDPSPPITEGNCGDLTDGGPMAGPDCVTAKIACGETVVGHTRGGANVFDTRFYESQYCTPALTNHDSGDERVYLLELPPGDRHAKVWLDTPCADLDLAAIRVIDAATCPNASSTVKQCEMSVQPGTRRERVEFASQVATSWLLVVEGKGDAEGAFALTVTCGEGLQ